MHIGLAVLGAVMRGSRQESLIRHGSGQMVNPRINPEFTDQLCSCFRSSLFSFALVAIDSKLVGLLATGSAGILLTMGGISIEGCVQCS